MMEAPCHPTLLNMLEDIPLHCPAIEDLIMDVSVDQVFMGLPYVHLTLCLLRDMCFTDESSPSQSVRE